MEPNKELTKNKNDYFNNLLSHSPSNDVNSQMIKNIDQIMKEAEHQIKHHLQDGSLKMTFDPENTKNYENLALVNKKKEINPFDSRYKRFLLNTDREKSQERYDIFKKIKEQYSKEKTAIVVKQVQNKIKQWTQKKLEIQRRNQKSKQRKQRMEREKLEQLKRQELEKKQMDHFQKKQQLLNRLKILEKRKQERQEFMKQSSVRSLSVKAPKYKEIQQKFNQIQQKIKEEQKKILESKKLSMIVKKEEIQQHEKKYEQVRKQKEEQRKKKIKCKIRDDNDLSMRGQFSTFSLQHMLQQKEEKEKQKRRKNFAEKVKSSVNLMRRQKQKQNEEQNEQMKTEQVKKNTDQQIKLSDKRQKVRRKRVKHELNESADYRQLGNDYLKQLRMLNKNKQILRKSSSLPKLNLPNETSQKSNYKNYLTEIKLQIKRKGVKDEIEQVKRSCRSKVEVYQQLNKKSSEYEQNMIKKIKQLGRIDKYNDSVQKECQIDELHARYIKMRLACIDN